MQKTASDSGTMLVVKQQYDNMEVVTVGNFTDSTTDEWEHGVATVSVLNAF